MTTKQIVLILQKPDGDVEIVKETKLDLVTLPHPKGIPVVYILLSGNILELQSIQLKKYASWFINQKVSSSSCFYMASKLDLRFLCLPFFMNNVSRFSPLDQILVGADGCSRLDLSNSHRWKLDEIADVKDLGDDLIVYRFNEAKTMKWLISKVNRVAIVLMRRRQSRLSAENATFVSSFASSAQTSRSSKGDSMGPTLSIEPEPIDIKLGLQIVADYLDDAMTVRLVGLLGLSMCDLECTKNQNTKRKADWETELEVFDDVIVQIPCFFSIDLLLHIYYITIFIPTCAVTNIQVFLFLLFSCSIIRLRKRHQRTSCLKNHTFQLRQSRLSHPQRLQQCLRLFILPV